MVYNKVIHGKQEKEIKEEKKPYEVQQMEGLLGSSGWNLVVDKLNKRQQEYKDKIIKQRPAGATDQEKIAAYEFIVRTNDIILEIENLKTLPDEIKNEYSNENFTGSVNV